jgi:hypothetical protein
LLDRFGLGAVESMPTAPYSMLGDGLDPGNDFWLQADPVHLSPQRNDCVVLPPTQFELSEADSLVQALNDYFHADDMRFVRGSRERWYVRCSTAIELSTPPTAAVCGRAMAAFQPQGRDAQRWSRIANEAQMMLHAHPINEAREARGVATINGLWFWGGGVVRPTTPRAAIIYADDVLSRGLASASDAPVRALREFSPSPTSTVLVIDRSLQSAHERSDPDAWTHNIQRLDSALLQPALNVLRGGNLTAIHLLTDGPLGLQEWTLTRGHLLHVWRGRSKFFDRS